MKVHSIQSNDVCRAEEIGEGIGTHALHIQGPCLNQYLIALVPCPQAKLVWPYKLLAVNQIELSVSVGKISSEVALRTFEHCLEDPTLPPK